MAAGYQGLYEQLTAPARVPLPPLSAPPLVRLDHPLASSNGAGVA